MKTLGALLAVLALFVTADAGAQTFDGKQLTAASLLADTSAIIPGKPFTVALDLKTVEGWHSYWKYPGDAGVPTTVAWQLPPGFTAGPLEWPVPAIEDDEGNLETYIYKDEAFLLVEITPPAKIDGGQVTLKADAKWLVCKKTCVPGGASLSLTLPVATTAAPANQALFEKYRALLPKPQGAPFKVTWVRDSKNVYLTVRGASAGVEFFPLPGDGTTVGHPKAEKMEDGVRFTIPAQADKPPAVVNGVVGVGSPPASAWLVNEPNSAPESAIVPTSGASPAGPGLLGFLLSGFIGGFILNLMPCVLPVIALKIFGFVNQAGQTPGKVFRLGLAFVAGIFVWFLSLAALVSGFKAAGHDLSWGFQFQNPYCLLGISAALFVFALNLFGVFEVTLPQQAGTGALNLSAREGYGGAFFHGMFATLLATSCSAPFLGAALGFAFVQPPATIFAVFTAIAAGMSFPYLLLTAQPAWMRFLPKPGMWMVRFKQFTGFLLLGTLLWLLSILGQERGSVAIIDAAAFLLCLGVACWIKGILPADAGSLGARAAGFASMACIVLAGYFVFFTAAVTAVAAPQQAEVNWPAFTPDVLQKSLTTGKPVFIDFTANWCLNCKYNEKFVLQSDPVKEAFKKEGVITLKADWTNGDPVITQLLRKFGRAGVPVYAIYPASGGDPIILPEILTPQTVLDGLQRAAKG